MTHHRRQRVFAGCLAAAALAALTACSGTEAPPTGLPGAGCPADGAKPLTLVVGARMGSPRPDLPGTVKALVEAAARNNQKVQVVRVDGQPTIALSADVQITGQNDVQRAKQVDEVVERVVQFVGQLVPKQPEADVLSALGEAARVTPKGGTVVLVDSGIATAGAVSFRDKDMFGAEPTDVAEYLAAQHLLPKLDGQSVLLVGVGGTAEPQPALDENLRSRVVKLWQAVAGKAGAACVNELSIPSRRDAFQTSVPVTVVALPSPPVFQPCGTTVLADSDSVGFAPNTADLRDPAAAERTIQQLVGQVAGGTQRITLVGNTASVGSPEGNRELSLRRADAVKGILVRLGVPADRITTRGDGNTGKYHENDRGPNGALIPAAAARNRSVVVELSCQG